MIKVKIIKKVQRIGKYINPKIGSIIEIRDWGYAQSLVSHGVAEIVEVISEVPLSMPKPKLKTLEQMGEETLVQLGLYSFKGAIKFGSKGYFVYVPSNLAGALKLKQGTRILVGIFPIKER